MTKATGFMMCVAGVVVFLTCMNPFTYFSIAGVLFASALLGTGIVMWRKGNKGYCEWVSDEEIEGWDWQNTDSERAFQESPEGQTYAEWVYGDEHEEES